MQMCLDGQVPEFDSNMIAKRYCFAPNSTIWTMNVHIERGYITLRHEIGRQVSSSEDHPPPLAISSSSVIDRSSIRHIGPGLLRRLNAAVGVYRVIKEMERESAHLALYSTAVGVD